MSPVYSAALPVYSKVVDPSAADYLISTTRILRHGECVTENASVSPLLLIDSCCFSISLDESTFSLSVLMRLE